MRMEENKIIIYTSSDGQTKIDVRLEDETLWLTQQQIAELYQTSRTNVVEHIKHIYEEQELDENSTCRNFRQVRIEGSRQVEREIPFYNLDMIISLGYRIKSRIATHFRQWATQRLKEYMIKGFTLDDDRLKNWVEVVTGRSFWNVSEIFVPRKKYFIVRCWKYMQQVSTMTLELLYHRNSSRKYRINTLCHSRTYSC